MHTNTVPHKPNSPIYAVGRLLLGLLIAAIAIPVAWTICTLLQLPGALFNYLTGFDAEKYMVAWFLVFSICPATIFCIFAARKVRTVQLWPNSNADTVDTRKQLYRMFWFGIFLGSFLFVLMMGFATVQLILFGA